MAITYTAKVFTTMWAGSVVEIREDGYAKVRRISFDGPSDDRRAEAFAAQLNAGREVLAAREGE